MAILRDTTGAVIAVWQAGDHFGAQLVNEPGTLCWNELATADLARSKAFYSAVFGWGWGGGDAYAEARVGGRTVCAAMPRPPVIPAGVPDHWLPYFNTADLKGDTARAEALGATIPVGPTDLPDGPRFSVVADPQGAVFGLCQG